MANSRTTRAPSRARTAPKKPEGSGRRQQTVTVEKLQGMSQRQLDNLFRRSRAGDIPAGVADGIVIVARGRPVSRLATWVGGLGWRGKVFNPAGHDLLNRISPFGLPAVRAKVSRGTSLLDNRPTIVLDYSQTSFVAHYIRDEIREVAPGLYLGIVYWAQRKTINFVLDFRR